MVVKWLCVSDNGMQVITFRASRRRREMYCGHARLRVCVCVCPCLSVCLSVCPRPHPHTIARTRMKLGGVVARGCPLVMHYLADLQSVHGSHCYG